MQSVNTFTFCMLTGFLLLLSFTILMMVVVVEARMLAMEEGVGKCLNSMDRPWSSSWTLVMVTIGWWDQRVKMCLLVGPDRL